MEEEKEAAEKRKAEKEEEAKKDTIPGSEVETPRSDNAGDNTDKKAKDGEDKESEDSPETKAKKEKEADLKDTYGLDMMKFGNASIRSKNNGTHSPMMADRQFVALNTIEEEKNET